MKVEIDEKSGFCFGVVNAITKAEESLAKGVPVSCLGDIVHNRVEVSRLGGLGMRTVGHSDLPSLAGGTVLFRAHGEPPVTYRAAKDNGITVIDATCPVVAALQEKVKQAHASMKDADGQVVILGKRGHAEVVGLTGQVDGDAIVVESMEDLDLVDFSRPVYLLSQTTQSLALFDAVKTEIMSRAGDKNSVTVDDTICRQVSNRDPHLRGFAARHDVVVFVSGKKSSNGKALFSACESVNPASYKIEDESELRAGWFEGAGTVGVCGATSTPKWLMERVAGAIMALAEKDRA